MPEAYSCQTTFEDGVQAWLSGVLLGGLLYFQRGVPAAELEGGDVVIEPWLLVHQAPSDVLLRNTGQAGERLAGESAGSLPSRAQGEALGEPERVPQRGADRLIDFALQVGTAFESDLGQVAVVHVAG